MTTLILLLGTQEIFVEVDLIWVFLIYFRRLKLHIPLLVFPHLTGPRHTGESKIMKQLPFQFSGFSGRTCQLLTKKLIVKGINEIGPTVSLGHSAP